MLSLHKDSCLRVAPGDSESLRLKHSWSQGDENDGLWNQQSAWVVETKFQPQISWPMLAHLVFWTSIRLTRWKRKRCHQVQDSNRSSETPSLDFRAWDFQSWKPWICWKLSASLDHVRGPGPNISKVLGENKHIHIRYDSYSSVASGYFSSQLTLWIQIQYDNLHPHL